MVAVDRVVWWAAEAMVVVAVAAVSMVSVGLGAVTMAVAARVGAATAEGSLAAEVAAEMEMGAMQGVADMGVMAAKVARVVMEVGSEVWGYVVDEMAVVD